MGFWLLFGGVVTVIKGINVFLNVISDYRCVRVFKLLVYLGTGCCTAFLLRALRACDFSLSKGPFYLGAAAVYRVSVEFLFRLSRCFKGGW